MAAGFTVLVTVMSTLGGAGTTVAAVLEEAEVAVAVAVAVAVVVVAEAVAPVVPLPLLLALKLLLSLLTLSGTGLPTAQHATDRMALHLPFRGALVW